MGADSIALSAEELTIWPLSPPPPSLHQCMHGAIEHAENASLLNWLMAGYLAAWPDEGHLPVAQQCRMSLWQPLNQRKNSSPCLTDRQQSVPWRGPQTEDQSSPRSLAWRSCYGTRTPSKESHRRPVWRTPSGDPWLTRSMAKVSGNGRGGGGVVAAGDWSLQVEIAIYWSPHDV